MKRLRAEEDGSTLLLTIFYSVLALALILMVTAAASLYLERKRLFTLADGAALVGAEAFDLRAVSVTAEGPRPRLRSADVARAVNAYLVTAPTGDFEGLRVNRAVTVDGLSATVELSAYWRPPVLSIIAPEGFPIGVTAVARSVFG
jgi:hypothetical protein